LTLRQGRCGGRGAGTFGGRAAGDVARHGRARARVHRAPEPLERGLPGRAEHVADLAPAVARRTGLVDALLQGGGGRRRQFPRRGQGGQWRPAAGTPHRLGQAAGGAEYPGRDRVRPARRTVRDKFLMTRPGRQECFRIRFTATAGNVSLAPCGAPASGVAVASASTSSLLSGKLATACLARDRFFHVCHHAA
jgi:hypothetical protein